jgi:hypothetical protein
MRRGKAAPKKRGVALVFEAYESKLGRAPAYDYNDMIMEDAQSARFGQEPSSLTPGEIPVYLSDEHQDKQFAKQDIGTSRRLPRNPKLSSWRRLTGDIPLPWVQRLRTLNIYKTLPGGSLLNLRAITVQPERYFPALTVSSNATASWNQNTERRKKKNRRVCFRLAEEYFVAMK